MHRTLFGWLMASVFLSLFVAQGCGGGPDPVADRKKSAGTETAADQVEPEGSAAGSDRVVDGAAADTAILCRVVAGQPVGGFLAEIGQSALLCEVDKQTGLGQDQHVRRATGLDVDARLFFAKILQSA